MSSTLERSKALAETRRKVDMKLEVITIPVSDVERAKRFYAGLGWRLDADFDRGDAFRAIQFTPPGSACSLHFGKGITSAAPGSAHGLFLAVSDIDAAREHLIACGAEVSEVFHLTPGDPPAAGRDPQRRPYATYATFKDPDGNSWLMQEITARLPGRLDGDETRFGSASDLAATLRRAAAAHHAHEEKVGAHDDEWPDWYAEFMVAEQAGRPLPE
ncbi:VOC family protein [Ramlibacter montanisoli]|uniref:Glyoxalase n=1 Tax=Ramlibacter montanisoli TaxID=2732512 RepID=A0A849KAD6_9BURK|nr:VOC family protein [Ramlibacter montanisoli]NNU42005.1 glyoxalase [Ramlibacter montanisoli]